ncbi:MAG: polysaccharide biosynthesis C-terminal domain-containing protein [Nanoarchaeota archaeon]|nr:polysaccharide biosynthesis C-terminal domain-containing protein [Nanoarchaeota archaeon]
MVRVDDRKEVVGVFGISIFSKVLTYFLLLVLGNWYLVADYGASTFVFAVFNIVLFFSLVGLPDTLVPWIIQKRDYHAILYFLLFLNVLVGVVGLFVAFYYPFILPLVVFFPFSVLSAFGRVFLRIQHRYRLIQWLSALFIFMQLLFSLLFVSFGRSGIVLAFACAFFVDAFVFAWCTRQQMVFAFKKFSFDLGVVGSFLRKGFITSLITLSFAFLGWIDTSLLGLMGSFEDVARYNIAAPVANVLSIIGLTLSMFLLTRSAEVCDKKSSKLLLAGTLRVALVLSLLGAVLVGSFGGLAIRLFFPKYVGVELFSAVLAIGLVFYTVYVLIATYLNGKLQPEKVVLPLVLAAVVNIVLDIVLIPRFGVLGIAVATMVAHMLAFVLLVREVRMGRAVWPAAFVPFLVYGAYMLGVFGVLLIIPLLFLFFSLGLLKKSDVALISSLVRHVFKK